MLSVTKLNMGKTVKSTKKYTQKFREEWLTNSLYKNWLLRVSGDSTKCSCRYCSCILNAKVYDIDKHLKTEKHKKAAQPHSNERQPQNSFYHLKKLVTT